MRREDNVYSRLGLIELFPRDLRKLREKKEEKITISGNNIKMKENFWDEQAKKNSEAKIEIPPKKI